MFLNERIIINFITGAFKLTTRSRLRVDRRGDPECRDKEGGS